MDSSMNNPPDNMNGGLGARSGISCWGIVSYAQWPRGVVLINEWDMPYGTGRD